MGAVLEGVGECIGGLFTGFFDGLESDTITTRLP